jgi:hypothetical protein
MPADGGPKGRYHKRLKAKQLRADRGYHTRIVPQQAAAAHRQAALRKESTISQMWCLVVAAAALLSIPVLYLAGAIVVGLNGHYSTWHAAA